LQDAALGLLGVIADTVDLLEPTVALGAESGDESSDSHLGRLLRCAVHNTSLAATRMYVDLVAKDLQDAYRRARPADNLRVRRRG